MFPFSFLNLNYCVNTFNLVPVFIVSPANLFSSIKPDNDKFVKELDRELYRLEKSGIKTAYFSL